MITRRHFALGCLALCGVGSPRRRGTAGRGTSDHATAGHVGEASLPAWSAGELDIHHIAMGRGSATFILGPDGTTLLIDCGATNSDPALTAPARPDGSRRPGEWVARYARHHARAAGRDTLDYLVVSHIHPDHVGDVPAGVAPAEADGFVPTGVSEVDRLMPAALVIDRGYPDYARVPPLDAPFVANYRAWLDARRRSGRRVEAVEVGSDRQILARQSSTALPGALAAPSASALPMPGPRSASASTDRPRHPAFSVRTIAADGRVWTGRGTATRSLFPDLATLPDSDRPTENLCSIALRVSYGRFSYFTAGDLTAHTRDGRLPWMDVETPVVQAAGRVEVAAATHHGYFDACGPAFTAVLDAQAYVIPAWHATHPGPAQIERLIGAWPGERPRDVFATEMLPANRQINARWVPQMRSLQGHVIVRVAPNGEHYRIFVMDNTTEHGPVTLTCGPYHCR